MTALDVSPPEHAPRPASVRPMALAFEGVSHSYGRGWAVEDVTFSVAPGAVVALLGESGCGKSTLLRIAAGVERPVRGVVSLGGRAVSGDGVFLPPEKRGVGLMFQDYALFPHMSLLANVTFGLRGRPRADALSTARARLAQVGLSTYERKHPGELSGGEQQRAALARAVAPQPGLLLMDEPFSGLDRRLRDSVRDDTLAVLRETGATAVIVTHDPEEAMRMADRIVLMRRGRVAQQGAPEELYRAPASLFAARFFSEINEIPCVVKDGRATSALGDAPAPGVKDGPAVLAVRPHALKIGPRGEGVVGRIVERRFLGETEQATLVVDGLDAPLRARRPPGEAPVPGADVGVTLCGAETLVFAADGA
ncbi:ABC transporter ATP-binding protein [Methylopila henanensis]|uniref:ABC transporter ATP-binding protein n=1 Tax=Methylopila henanensis TaxID=873516 RepID=A0ABW4K558_9HYPH